MMHPGVEVLTQNLKIPIEHLILLVFLIGSIIIYAKDFRIGVMLTFVGSGGLFVWYYIVGYNYIPTLTVFLMSLVVLSLTFYGVAKSAQQGGVI